MEDKEASDDALANLLSVPMALKAAVRLGLPDLIWQEGANLPISSHQLAILVKTKFGLSTEPDAINLQRISRLLASHGVFKEVPDGDGPLKKRFQLTDVGRTLATDPQSGLSLGAYVLQHHQDALVQGWNHLHESMLYTSQEATPVHCTKRTTDLR